MTYQEAMQKAAEYKRANVVRCPKCGSHAVIAYTDVNSSAWFELKGLTGEMNPKCLNCGQPLNSGNPEERWEVVAEFINGKQTPNKND